MSQAAFWSQDLMWHRVPGGLWPLAPWGASAHWGGMADGWVSAELLMEDQLLLFESTWDEIRPPGESSVSDVVSVGPVKLRNGGPKYFDINLSGGLRVESIS